MRRCAGTQLDSEVVYAFHMMLRRRENDRNRERSAPPDAQGFGRSSPKRPLDSSDTESG
jgi:hypothetical protein